MTTHHITVLRELSLPVLPICQYFPSAADGASSDRLWRSPRKTSSAFPQPFDCRIDATSPPLTILFSPSSHLHILIHHISHPTGRTPIVWLERKKKRCKEQARKTITKRDTKVDFIHLVPWSKSFGGKRRSTFYSWIASELIHNGLAGRAEGAGCGKRRGIEWGEGRQRCLLGGHAGKIESLR